MLQDDIKKEVARKYRKNKALVDRFNELMPKVIKFGLDEIR